MMFSNDKQAHCYSMGIYFVRTHDSMNIEMEMESDISTRGEITPT